MILGIDEVGRGPWAGPLVVGAVVMGGEAIEGLTDSKKLSKRRREEMAERIYKSSKAACLGWVEPHEIDSIGLSASLELATRRAVESVKTSYSEIIIDGTVNFLKNTTKGKYVAVMKKADLLIPSVSAASIIAKVARDNYMNEQDKLYPGYGFASNVGYGTARHREAIKELGVTPLHRLSFEPLKPYRVNNRISPVASNVTTTSVGRKAEGEASRYLERQGHRIIERNWRTKQCEIDIISSKGDRLYFTEVKYRKSPGHGDGLDAITANKLRQMAFAAEYYVQVRGLGGYDRQLSAASLSGQPPKLDAFLTLE